MQDLFCLLSQERILNSSRDRLREGDISTRLCTRISDISPSSVQYVRDFYSKNTHIGLTAENCGSEVQRRIDHRPIKLREWCIKFVSLVLSQHDKVLHTMYFIRMPMLRCNVLTCQKRIHKIALNVAAHLKTLYDTERKQTNKTCTIAIYILFFFSPRGVNMYYIHTYMLYTLGKT